jgi:hypothetical protein
MEKKCHVIFASNNYISTKLDGSCHNNLADDDCEKKNKKTIWTYTPNVLSLIQQLGIIGFR